MDLTEIKRIAAKINQQSIQCFFSRWLFNKVQPKQRLKETQIFLTYQRGAIKMGETW